LISVYKDVQQWVYRVYDANRTKCV